MADSATLEAFLGSVTVDDAVFALRPDYRAGLVAVAGLEPGRSDAVSERLLSAAESTARETLRTQPVEELAHVAAWRDAYRAFGAKPQRTRHSLEALLRRAEPGLPRVNRLTDIYNAVSVTHLVPLGGEDLDGYRGAPRLVRANGAEPFDTVAGGDDVIEHPEPGEVIWRDDEGVTCRRWNWRQGRRTRLTDSTTSAFFILDALAPLDDAALEAALEELVAHLSGLGRSVSVARRTISGPAA